MITPKSPLESSHFPVMLEEVIKTSSLKKGYEIIDCTFGGGSYTKKFLDFPGTNVIALDRDTHVFKFSKEVKKKYPSRFNFYQKKFSELDTTIKNKLVDVIVFDLGLSSIQLNNFARGFSFSSKESLDMSMGLCDISAADVVNTFSENKLKLIIKILGEEKEASKIAKNIIKSRKIKKITKVDQLVEIIEKSKIKKFKKKINPSTKTFQALRIFVNKEITELINGIINATKILKPGGKILVISFHSIEDKIVKYFFSNFSSNHSRPSRYFPEDTKKNISLFEAYKNKTIRPTPKELFANPPSRSAKLRFAVRNKNDFFYPVDLKRKFKKYLELERFYA